MTVPLLEPRRLSSHYLKSLCNYGIRRQALSTGPLPLKATNRVMDLVAWSLFPGVSEETWHP